MPSAFDLSHRIAGWRKRAVETFTTTHFTNPRTELAGGDAKQDIQRQSRAKLRVPENRSAKLQPAVYGHVGRFLFALMFPRQVRVSRPREKKPPVCLPEGRSPFDKHVA